MTYNPYNGNTKSPTGQQPFTGAGGAPAGYIPAYGTQPQQVPFMMPPPAGAFVPGAGIAPAGPQIPGMLPLEQSYIENILRLNRGKLATVHALFDTGTNNAVFRDFTGLVEAAGRDHLILSSPETGQRILLPMVYFGYATFDEELEYSYPFNGVPQQGMTTYTPR